MDYNSLCLGFDYFSFCYNSMCLLVTMLVWEGNSKHGCKTFKKTKKINCKNGSKK